MTPFKMSQAPASITPMSGNSEQSARHVEWRRGNWKHTRGPTTGGLSGFEVSEVRGTYEPGSRLRLQLLTEGDPIPGGLRRTSPPITGIMYGF